MDEEREEIEQFITQQPCPKCGQTSMRLTNIVGYVAPAAWYWECACGEGGSAGYESIPIVDIPPERLGEATELLREPNLEAYRSFVKEHGVVRPRNIALRCN